MDRREVGSVLKVSPGTPEHLESKEREDHQVYQDLQELQDFQLLVAVVHLDLQASLEREVRRETLALQGCLYQDPQDVRELLVPRVNQGLLDLQAIPQEEQTASSGSPGFPACREREVTQERRARKVRRVTPV